MSTPPTNDPLRAPKRELKAAGLAITRMIDAKTFDEFEFAWNDYLTRLEKSWEKLLHLSKGFAKFHSWHGKYASFRRQDQLVRYLHQARNADQHTLEESVEFQRAVHSFTLGRPGESVYIKSLKTDHAGRVSQYEGSAVPEITYQPPRIVLRAIKNRGQTYKPPTQHLGLPLASSNPVAVAQLGLKFYQDLVENAQNSFFAASA